MLYSYRRGARISRHLFWNLGGGLNIFVKSSKAVPHNIRFRQKWPHTEVAVALRTGLVQGSAAPVPTDILLGCDRSSALGRDAEMLAPDLRQLSNLVKNIACNAEFWLEAF